MTPSATINWELLTRLAHLAQQASATTDGTLVELLANSLAMPGGRLQLFGPVDTQELLWGDPPSEDLAPLSLWAGDELVGRLHLAGAGVASLDPGFATALAAHLALLLLNRQRAEEAVLLERLHALVCTRLELVGSLDPHVLLCTSLSLAAPLLGVKIGAIYSLEREAGSAELLAAGENGISLVASLPLHEDSLLLQAAREGPQTGRIVASPTRNYDHNSAALPTYPALALPLRTQHDLLGILLLILPNANANPRTARLAVRFAAELSLLVHTVRRFSQQQQRAHELFVLYENSQALTTVSELERMLARVAETISLALAADYCAVLLSDLNEPDTLRTISLYHEPDRLQLNGSGLHPGRPVGRSGLYGRSEPLLIEETGALAAHHPLAAALIADGCHSALVLPMHCYEEVCGLLVLGYARPRRNVTANERNLAQVLAAQVATTVAHRRRTQLEQQRVVEFELVQQATRHLGADLDLPATLEAVLDSALSLSHADAVRLSLMQEADPAPILAAQRGMHYPEAAATLTAYLCQLNRVLLIADMQQPAQLVPPGAFAPIPLPGGSPARAYLGLPLWLNHSLLGVLELFAEQPAAFGTAEGQLLQAFSGPAAQAISNATRYHDTLTGLQAHHAQLAALQRVSSQLAATLSQNEILAYVLEQALVVTGALHGLIALRSGTVERADNDLVLSTLGGAEAAEIYRDLLNEPAVESHQTFVVAEALGYGESERRALLGNPLAAELATAWRALEHHESVFSASLGADERTAAAAPTAQAALAVPIFYQSALYGVLLLLAPDAQHVADDTFDFLHALALQTAVGIGNAQRYTELEQLYRAQRNRAQILSNVLEIGQNLRTSRSLQNLLEQVGYSVMDSLNYRHVLFCLSEAHTPGHLRPLVAAGIPRDDLERLTQLRLPLALVESYLDPGFQVERAYFVPAAVAQRINARVAAKLFSPTPSETAAAPQTWQSGDRLLFPLRASDDRLLGLMLVAEPQDGSCPTTRTVEPLEIFADQAALAIENASLLQEATARAEQMEALFRVGSAASSTNDLDTLLRQVYHEIVAFLGIPDFFYIATYHPNNESVCFDLFLRRGEILTEAQKQVLPCSGLTRQIIQSGQPLLLNDLAHDQHYRTIAVQGFRGADEVQSWLGVPLLGQHGVIGVLSVQDTTPDAFSERDQQFLMTLASQLAIAVERTRLAEERERRIIELKAINAIARITSSTLKLPEMLQQVNTRLRDFLSLDSCSMFIYDQDRQRITFSLEFDEGELALDQRERPSSPGSLSEYIIQTRQPLCFADLGREYVSSGLQPLMFGSERASASWLGVPLIVRNSDVVGVIAVMSYTPALYGEREQNFLTTVASQLALGVQNARLLEHAQGRVQQLDLLNKVSVLANVETAVQRIYQVVVDAMAEATGVDQARLVIYDRNTGDAPAVAEYRQSGILEQIRIPIANNPSVVWLDKELRPLVAHDAQQEPLLAPSHATFRELDIRSIALVPLIVNGMVFGAVGLDFVGRYGTFTSEAIGLCQTIANQTSTSIARARALIEAESSANALGQKVNELFTLLEASRLLSSLLSPEEVLSQLMTLVKRRLKVTTVALWKINSDQMLMPTAIDGITDSNMRVPVGKGLTGRVAATEQPLVIADVNREGGSLYPSYQSEHHLISFMGVPVVYQGQTVGVLSVMTDELREFSQDDQNLLTGLASQSATALRNAELFSETRRNAQEMTDLFELSRDLAATLDIDIVQERVAAAILKLLEAELSAVLGLDEQQHVITQVLMDQQGRRNDLHIDFRLGGMTSRLIASGQVLAINDLQQVANVNPEALNQAIQSLLGITIVSQEQTLGVIWVGMHRPHVWSAHQCSLIEMIANQAAQAIDKARLFNKLSTLAAELEQRVKERTAELEQAGRQLREEKERIEAIHAITIELTTQLDLTNILCSTLELISAHLGVSRGGIMLRIADGKELSSRAELLTCGKAHSIDLPLDFDGRQTLADWVLEKQEPVNLPDVRMDTRWIQRPGQYQAVRSVAMVPLKTINNILGVLMLAREEVGGFSDSQMSLLGTIASVVTAAIGNAQLYSYIADLAAEKGKLLEEQREEGSKSAAVFRSVSEGVIVLDSDQRITLFNPAAEELLEIPAAYALHQPLSFLAHYGDDEATQKRAHVLYQNLYDGLQRMHQGKQIYSLSIDLSEPTQVIAANLAAVEDADGHSYGDVAVLRDITREIEADHAKRQFISDVSHELRTPLTSVKGYVDILLMGGPAAFSEDQFSYLQVIKKNTNELRALIEDILEFSRPDANKKLQFSMVDLASLIADVVQSLRIECERKQMQVILQVQPDLPTLIADQRRIRQVFLNLFTNAVKYTFEGGRIVVRAQLNPAGLMQVEVEDNGVGMSADQRKKLFRPFYRADNPLRDVAGGTGLGLAIARQIVEQHGGEMWVQTEQGKGSTFSFVLPLVPIRADPGDGEAA